jgi:hypothetical protein
VRWYSKEVEERPLMIYVSYALAIFAILVMVMNVILAFRLKAVLIGGEIRSRWNLLTNFMLLFLLGYILSPLLLVFSVPVEYMGVVVFLIFLFGAIFILIVIRIIREILAVMGVLEE